MRFTKETAVAYQIKIHFSSFFPVHVGDLDMTNSPPFDPRTYCPDSPLYAPTPDTDAPLQPTPFTLDDYGEDRARTSHLPDTWQEHWRNIVRASKKRRYIRRYKDFRRRLRKWRKTHTL